MDIYLIRHPQPRQCRGVCYGRTDVPVEAGVLAAAVVSLRLTIPGEVLRLAAIYTSPASRCLDLARALASPRGIGVFEELQEMDFGAWEGKPWESVPRAALDEWASDIWSYRAGGGESAAMVAARWRRWATRVGAETAKEDVPVIAVTHAGLIRVALAGVSRDNLDLSREVPFGSVHRVDVGASLGVAP